MNGHTGHPGTTELAEFGAGISEGARGDWVAAHLADCPRCVSVAAQLDEVSALLSAVPAPAMPDEVSRRILEALPRQDRPAVTLTGIPGGALGGPKTPGTPHSPGTPTAALRGVRGPRRSRRFRATAGALLAAAACLVLAAVGYEMSAPSGTSIPTASGKSPSAPAGMTARGSAPGAHHDSRQAIGPAMGPVADPHRAPVFYVVSSALDYQKTALLAQVRQQVATERTPRVSGSLPSGTLVDCVMRLTGGSVPLLVERAMYQSRPVYVIAAHTHAWIVATGCTAARPDVIVSVALSPAAG